MLLPIIQIHDFIDLSDFDTFSMYSFFTLDVRMDLIPGRQLKQITEIGAVEEWFRSHSGQGTNSIFEAEYYMTGDRVWLPYHERSPDLKLSGNTPRPWVSPEPTACRRDHPNGLPQPQLQPCIPLSQIAMKFFHLSIR